MSDCIFSFLTILNDEDRFHRLHDLYTIDDFSNNNICNHTLLHDKIEGCLTFAYKLLNSIKGQIDYNYHYHYISTIFLVKHNNKCIMVMFNDRANRDWETGLLNYNIIDDVLKKENLVRVSNQKELFQ